MKILQLSIPTVALAVAFGISTPTETQGYDTLGTVLGLNQRDFRIFNNFTAASANNNTTPDANFPGYTGADMAIWKACIEWQSRLHGDGNGDSTQPGGLGSGGANFDPSFQGNALGVGNTNSNSHSQLTGCGGGVLAFTEGPANDGWRIRYYQCISWQDGPGTISFSGYDLQAVACHEYGHALGLDHSASGGATMFPTISNGSEGERSIHADDIAGVQAIYGVEDTGVKPRITGLSLVGTSLTITGANFDATDNDVWFSQIGPGGGGPEEVLGVPSSGGGTQIVVSVPVTAGRGDVLVRNVGSGSGGSSLSNAWPFDPGDPPACPAVTNYCVGAVSSAGVGAVMNWQGSQSVLTNDFTLEVNNCPTNKFGLFYYGPSQIQVAFGDGFRCVGGSTKRLPLVQTDFVGYAAYMLNLSTAPNVAAGVTQNFQVWFRDPMGPGGNGFNTSDGLSVPFCD